MKRLMPMMLLGALVAVSGCSFHTRVAPDAVGQTVADLATETDETVRASVDWWHVFGDETLNALVDRALTENATLDLAEAGVRKAEAFLSAQKAADLPAVTVNGAVGRARSIGFMGGISDTWSLSAAASYELDPWGRRQALKQQRVLDRDASRAALSSAMVSVSAQVADTWYLLTERQAQVALAEARVDLRKERLALVALRYNQGTVAAQQVYVARSELAAEEATLEGLHADVAVAGHALAILMNQNPGSLDQTFEGSSRPPFPVLPPLSEQPLSSRLILGRPDMVQALKQVEKADEAVAVSLADRFPSFSLTAGYGRSGVESGSFSGSGSIWNIGGNLLAPLIDWGARKSKVTADRAAFDEALARYRSTALAAFKEAEDALSRSRHGEAATAHVQEALDSAISNTAYVKSRYLEGASDYLTLLSTRIAENEASSRLFTNQRLLLSHRIGLARALGGSFSEARAKKEGKREGGGQPPPKG